MDAWRALRPSFFTGLVLSLALMLLPLAALGDAAAPEAPVLPADPTPVLEPSPTPIPTITPGEWDNAQTLRVLRRDGTVETLTMADYLWRVVAAEMPASFEEEALRAQAVCARTYSFWKRSAGSHEADGADICADSSCCQAYISPEDAAQRWGANEGAYSTKIAGAVADTDGQVLTYECALIQAAFF